MSTFDSSVKAVQWINDGVRLLDQRVLPADVRYLDFDEAGQLADAIRDMVVRGAPAIGITAAYAVVLAARSAYAQSPEDWRKRILPQLQALAAARPTAVNLAWAIAEMEKTFADCDADPFPVLLARARRIHAEDIDANIKMGAYGAELIGQVQGVLTHCNAGALATGGYGTALGVIRSSWDRRQLHKVFVNETRPWLQGSRLTAWELLQDGIPVTLIADNAASHLMKTGQVQWVIVGADRIAANGDVANKIGTYQLAITAQHHGVRFMVVAPRSTLDLNIASGEEIPIEDRAAGEVQGYLEQSAAPENCPAWNPAFDITPADLIDAIITESGVVERPDPAKMQALCHG